MHRITGCPPWYAPLVRGKALPPTTFDGKPVTPEEFWTSMFFSAPAARAMVKLGQGPALVKLYRSGYRDAGEFIEAADRRDMLPELAANLSVALKASGADGEASDLLLAASSRLEQAFRREPMRGTLARLAIVRAAQGDRPQALAAIEEATRKGWFPDGRDISLDLAEEPAFAGLRGEPRFEAVRKRLLDHVAQERAKLGPLKV